MTNSQQANALHAAVTIGFFGALIGYALGILVTYAPRDPYGLEPSVLSGIPSVYIHVGAGVLALAFAAVFAVTYRKPVLAALENPPTKA